jgi:hypothetical protein
LEIEKFQSIKPDGIRQELFAILVMSVIARILIIISTNSDVQSNTVEPQFKNSIITLASDMAIFASKNPVNSIEIFKEILMEIRRVKYYRSKKPRPSQPRVNKRPVNKWSETKMKKIASA